MAALSTIYGAAIVPTGSGRTDSGVHAFEQIAHADIPKAMNLAAVKRSLNGLLPPDIRIHGVSGVPEDWDARRHALARYYEYRIALRPTALERARMWIVTQPLDVEVLRGCASLLVGWHDVAGFCKHDPARDTYRTHFHGARWLSAAHELRFQICASHFYHRLVRRLVGMQVDLARRAEGMNRFRDALAGGRSLARISHQPSTTTTDMAPPASLRSVGRPQRIAEDTPSAGLGRKPCGQCHLSHFATKAGKKSGLAPCAPPQGLSFIGPIYQDETVDPENLTHMVWEVMARRFPSSRPLP